MNNEELELEQKINTIKRFFDTKKVTSIKVNTASIAKYYKINKLAYNLFHGGGDFIHMGISRNGVYKKEDFVEQAKVVEQYIKTLKKGKTLELATGRGASSAYLAKKYPNISFHAIDLPNGQLEYAFKKATTLKNFYPQEGDYHDLSNFSENFFDVVFIFEALCHSNDKRRVIQEVKRVLKRNGLFIIIDGYIGKSVSKLTSIEILAKQLTEKGMMVEDFEFYDKFKNSIKEEKFKIINEEDVSLLILPTLKRFERQARLLLSLPPIIVKTIIAISPPAFINNTLSGYLMPTLIKLGIAKYTILVTAKT